MFPCYPVYIDFVCEPVDGSTTKGETAHALATNSAFVTELKIRLAALCGTHLKRVRVDLLGDGVCITLECLAAPEQTRALAACRRTLATGADLASYLASTPFFPSPPLATAALSISVGEAVVCAPLAELGFAVDDFKRRLCELRLEMLTRVSWQRQGDPHLVAARCLTLMLEVMERLKLLQAFCKDHGLTQQYRAAVTLLRDDEWGYYKMDDCSACGMELLQLPFEHALTEDEPATASAATLGGMYHIMHILTRAGLKWKEATESHLARDSKPVALHSLVDALNAGKTFFAWSELHSMCVPLLDPHVRVKAGPKSFALASRDYTDSRRRALDAHVSTAMLHARYAARDDDFCMKIF